MNPTFTRRSFLKGLMSLAAATAVPIEIVPILGSLQVQDDTAYQTGKGIVEGIVSGIQPPGYIVLNGVVIPALALAINLTRDFNEVSLDGLTVHRIAGPQELDLSVTTLSPNIPFSWVGSLCDFEVYPTHREVIATGKAYLTSWQSQLGPDNDFNPIYDIELAGVRDIEWRAL